MVWVTYPGTADANLNPTTEGQTSFSHIHKVVDVLNFGQTLAAGDVVRLARVNLLNVPTELYFKIVVITGDPTTDLALRVGLAFTDSDDYPFSSELTDIYRDYFCTINTTGVDATAQVDITGTTLDRLDLNRSKLSRESTTFKQIWDELQKLTTNTDSSPTYFDIVVEFTTLAVTFDAVISISGSLAKTTVEFDPAVLGGV